MRHKNEKHTAYFDVLDALVKTAECALCALESVSLKRYFDGLLYEMVNDPKVRSELAHSKGYCHRHAHMLLDQSGAFGTALLYQDQIEAFRKCLEGFSVARSRYVAGRGERAWSAHAGCPACRIQDESRKRNLSVLCKWIADPDMRAAFQKSAGFCVPHFFVAVEFLKRPDDCEFVVQVHREKYADLARELAEFERKHNYQFSGEIMGKECDSWQRAVKMIVGSRGLF